MTTPDPTDLATVVEAPDPFSAEAIAAVLRDAGIDAIVARTATPSFGPLLLPKARKVPVRVRSEDLLTARRVLKENAAAAAALDWNDVDVHDVSDDARREGEVERDAASPSAVRRGMPLVAAAGWLVAASIVVLLLVATVMALLSLRSG